MNTLDFTIQLAQETGELLLGHYQPSGTQSHFKSDRTVVTEADLAADNHLQRRISTAYPDDGILSEEAETIYPANTHAVWVIDPLDGTTNFSLGLHYWGVSIARFVNGYPNVVVLYFPLLDELIFASRGDGAYLNGNRLEVKPQNPSQPASFFSCCSRAFRFYNLRIKYKIRILGSAAYGLATVARGSAILALEVTPKIWDIAASWLINHEAGGKIAPLDGDNPFPLISGFDYRSKNFPLLAAATSELLVEGQSKINKR